MISYLLQAGTNQKYVPGTQIFYNSIQKQLTMHIFVKAYTCTLISYLLQAGTNQKYVPGTQIFYNSIQKQLTMHIKMERVGCFQATVSYGDISLKNGDFNILVLSRKLLNMPALEKMLFQNNIRPSDLLWARVIVP